MRAVSLVGLSQGINRLRVKGGASPKGLYDLVNGYLNQEGVVVPRPGTIRTETLNGNTVGLASIDGIFHVFSITPQAVPSGYANDVLVNPTDNATALSKIWFAKPFMGFLYVVAEFADSSIYHYWLQNGGSWAADTVYMNTSIVEPSTPNGYAYQATRDTTPNPTWSEVSVVAVNDIVEPTEYTGYAYKATAVAGTNVHTGSVEPSWPTKNGAQIQEFGDFRATTSSPSTGSSAATGSSSVDPTITDRYGDSATVANDSTITSASTAATTAQAATDVTTWLAGQFYMPGAVVRPTTNQGAYVNAILNGDFEAGNVDWTLGTGWTITNTPGGAYQGSYFAAFSNTGAGFFDIEMATPLEVSPGQSVTANGYGMGDSDGAVYFGLRWRDSGGAVLSSVLGGKVSGGSGYNPTTYSAGSVTGTAPAGAATVAFFAEYQTGSSSARAGRVDLVSWNLATPAAVSNFLYEAVQSAGGYSGSVEPTWPTVDGNEVVDGAITWKAVGTSIITWQAVPIMESGATEPTWPTAIGQSVRDGSMSWTCASRRITDTNCPNSNSVVLNSSHVFAVNKDVVDYSAAVDPTDWTSANNAGYLPTGLNNYGDNPMALLGLYRSNLMAFNAGGFQMWQTDPDPANMAILDAEPVGSVHPRGGQAVGNDYIFVTQVGVRNVGLVGFTANMQVGNTGQPVDAIIRPLVKAGTYEAISLYDPSRGQYWVFFGPQAIVLTMNGQFQTSWSRYVFPDTITDWTMSAGILYLRTAGNLVWQIDDDTLVDDSGGNNTLFTGTIQWPYLDSGAIGTNKQMIGFDIVGTGALTVQFGFDQSDPTTFSDNAGFSTSAGVTPPYSLSAADTVPGEPIPMSMNAPSYTPVLIFAGNQAWTLQAMNLYVNDARGAGVTG